MAPILMFAGAILGGVGQLQAGAAAKAQAISQQNLAEYNARVQEREAEALRMKAKFATQRQAERGARIKSRMTAKIAAAGGLGSPVAIDLAAEQAAELELENLLIGFVGETEAQRAETQAEIDRLSGRMARRRGISAETAGRIGAGTSLLTGFGAALQ